jgi:aminoglycoside phosphotransferase
MTILAILDVLDQASLLPRSIEHLRRVGVGRIVALDAGSTDGSLEILAEEERAGDVWCVEVSADSPGDRVRDIRSAMMRESGATWLVQVEVNEFLLPVTGTLRRLPELDRADALSIFSYNVVLGPGGALMPWPLVAADYDQVMLYARPEASFADLGVEPDRPGVERLLPPRLMVRPEAVGHLPTGEHDLDVDGGHAWRQRAARDVLVARVPLGTPDSQAIDGEGLRGLRRTHVVRSAADVLLDPAGDLQAVARTEAISRAQPWLSMAGQVCAIEGIPIRQDLKPTFPSSYPTVLVPPQHVIKLFPRDDLGQQTLVRESDGLRRAAGAPGLPIPRVIATGDLDPEWAYLVMTMVPGQALTFLLDSLDRDGVRDVAAWLGDFARRLHATALDDRSVADGIAAFSALVRHLHSGATERLRDRGALPDHLLAQVAAWLPTAAEMLDAPGGIVLAHGDLEDDHVMMSRAVDLDDRRPVAVIDFGDSRIGHPYFELGPAWWTWLNQDRRYLDAFLDAARWPGWGETGFARMAMAWTLIRCSWNPKAPPFLDQVHDLDELAVLGFGPDS